MKVSAVLTYEMLSKKSPASLGLWLLSAFDTSGDALIAPTNLSIKFRLTSRSINPL